MNMQSLPSDVIIVLMRYLSTRDLARLSLACKYLHTLVEEYGWKNYLRANARPSYGLHHSFLHWDDRSQVRYNTIADRHWAYTEFVARPLSQKWMGKLQPTLAINSSRFLVAAGNTIYSYGFTTAKPGASPGMRFECLYTTSSQLQARRDITTLTFAADGGDDRTIFIGYANGGLEHIVLPPCNIGEEGTAIDPSYRTRYRFHGGDPVESVSSAGDYILSVSSGGTAVFFNRFALAKSDESSQTIELGARSWSTHLSARASTPYAVFGTSSMTPLTVHTLQASHLSPIPSALLSSSAEDKDERPSAVYGISGAPPSSPWGSSDQVIVSGWYDGVVRVHDMRSSSRYASSSVTDKNGKPAPLRPVLSIYDPWTFEPIYDVSCGGGNSSHVAAGTARHSVVALWDVRAPTQGWSVHAPGNDSSPVYSLILESTRLFGATQSRPFVLDFGTDSSEVTYPPLPRNYRDDGLKKRDRSGVGFYVTKYSHARTREAEILAVRGGR